MTILHVSGSRGVGKSVVAWELYLRAVRAGVTTGYVDLAQLGFHRPPSPDSVIARNVDAIWQTCRDAGAHALVVSGYSAQPIPGATLCWLHASRERLRERLLSRGRGEGPPIPGDDLRGRPAHQLTRLAETVVDPPDYADLVLTTDNLTVTEVADAIRDRLGFMA